MLELTRDAAGLLCFAVLAIAPGAWLGLRLPGDTLSRAERLGLSVALSPLILVVQFYASSPLGLDFAVMPWLLSALNLPSLWPAFRARAAPRNVDWRSVGAWTAALAIPALCLLSPLWIWPEQRFFFSHSWMHSDVVYAIANGALRPEEPELAGLALAYPWAGHVVQALYSGALGAAPVGTYWLPNLVFAGVIFGFAASLTGTLGGGRIARCAAVLLLCFGVNFVGYWLEAGFVPDDIDDFPQLFGDVRYTPWLWKFRFFNQMPMALAAFAGLLVLLSRLRSAALDAVEAATLASLLAGVGLVYALLLPAAYLPVLVWLLGTLPAKERRPLAILRGVATPALVLTGVGVVSIAHALWVRVDASGVGMGLSELADAAAKLSSSVFALAPLLAGVAVVHAKIGRSATGRMLLGTAAGSVLLYVAVSIPFWSNEYKFVFTAAFALAPFAGLASERLLQRTRTAALPILLAASLVLALPFALKLRAEAGATDLPRIETSDFDLRLAAGEPLKGATDAIRERTPVDTIVLAESSAIHLPTLTQRSFYVPPAQDVPHPGVWIPCIEILRYPRAHDLHGLNTREAERDVLFDPDDPNWLRFWIGRLLARGRPLAILIDLEQHARLDAWLSETKEADLLDRDASYAVWVFNAGVAPPR